MLAYRPRHTTHARTHRVLHVGHHSKGEQRNVSHQHHQKRQVENTVDAIVRAMAELEADYPDVVQVLQQAKQQNLLSGRFEVDALPAANRSYENRGNDEEDSTEEETSSSSRNIQVTSATPGLFDDSKTKDKPAKRRESSVLTGNKGAKKEVSRWDAFRDKMTPWKSDE